MIKFYIAHIYIHQLLYSMKLIFTIFLTSITLSVCAQRNFVKGTYNTLSGEEKQTHIDYQNWEKNPEFINIKSDLTSSKITKLTVSEIQSFSLTSGDRYESFIVDVDKSPTNINQMVPGSEALIVSDTVFLRVLVKGTVSLYHLKDEAAKDHFFIKKGVEKPVELIYQKIKVVTDSRVVLSQSPIYRGMLSVILTDCPEVSDKISKLAFNTGSLKKIVMDYNQCVSGSKGNYIANDEKIKFNMIALGGIAYNNLKINSNSNSTKLEGDYTKKINYTFGASLLATLPRGRQKWALQVDLMYKPYSVSNLYEEGVKSGSVYTSAFTTFDLKYLGVNTAVRYTFLSDMPVKPYVSVGVANNFIVSDNSNQVYYRNYYSSETNEERHPIQDGLRKHEQSIIVGFGVESKKILAQIKFEKGNGFSPFMFMRTSSSNVSLQIGYILK
jgi:hypothetical protein